MAFRTFIKSEDIEWAKKETAKFDAIKTYDKISSDNNWIGVLGELYFSRLLKEKEIPFEWTDFSKRMKGDIPDFIIEDKTIDVKTTFDNKMWIQEVKFDYYIYARVDEKIRHIYFTGYSKGEKLKAQIKRGTARKVTRLGREDYVVTVSLMGWMEGFVSKAKEGKL